MSLPNIINANTCVNPMLTLALISRPHGRIDLATMRPLSRTAPRQRASYDLVVSSSPCALAVNRCRNPMPFVPKFPMGAACRLRISIQLLRGHGGGVFLHRLPSDL